MPTDQTTETKHMPSRDPVNHDFTADESARWLLEFAHDLRERDGFHLTAAAMEKCVAALTAASQSRAPDQSERVRELEAEVGRLAEILNTPYLEHFSSAVVSEAQHQRYRWGDEQDAKKTAWDWFWTLGYLGGKAAHSALAGDWSKAQHHTITAAALLANWHRHIMAQLESVSESSNAK